MLHLIPMSSGRRASGWFCLATVLAAIANGTLSGAEQGWNPTGFIQPGGWVALGPFRSAAACSGSDGDLLALHVAPTSLDTQLPISGDAIDYDPALATAAPYEGPGESPHWRPLSESLTGETLDLSADAKAMGAPTEDVCTFLATYVDYAGPEPADVELCIGSDDGVQVWLDDRLVHNRNACRPHGRCQDHVIASITPGPHRILLGVWNHTGDFRASVALQQEGALLTDSAPEWSFLGWHRPEGMVPGESRTLAVRSLGKRRVASVCPSDRTAEIPLRITQAPAKGADPADPIVVRETLTGDIAAAEVLVANNGSVRDLPFVPPVQTGIFQDSRVILWQPVCPDGNGQATYLPQDDAYVLSNIGEDIFRQADSFTFAFSRIRGDFAVTAHIAARSFVPDSGWGKYGLMARRDLTTRSSFVMVNDLSDMNPVEMEFRPTHGGSDNSWIHFFPDGTHAESLRLERIGRDFIGSVSFDGVTFDFLGLYEWLDVPDDLLVGLAVTSHTTDCALGYMTITFDQVHLDLMPGAEIVPLTPPRSPGVEITWDVTREELAKGLSYTLRAPSGMLSFQGNAGGQELFGPTSLTIPERPPDLGPFPLSGLEHGHAIGERCVEARIAETADGLAIDGSGDGIGSDGDQLVFAYREIQGDFSARVQIAQRSLSGTFGIQARQDCSALSRFSSVLSHGGDRAALVRFASRVTHGGAGDRETGSALATARSSTLRLDRTGSVLIGYELADDKTWTEVDRHDWGSDAPLSLQLGLWVSSGRGCETVVVEFADWDVTQTLQPALFKRGDTDGDGVLVITDAIVLLRAIFLGEGALLCQAAADFDDSGALDISDAIASVNYQFKGGAPPPAPGVTSCGADPTADSLEPCDYLDSSCR